MPDYLAVDNECARILHVMQVWEVSGPSRLGGATWLWVDMRRVIRC